MRQLSWILGLLLFLLTLGFAVKNSETVTLHYYLDYQWQAPLVVILLAVFCAGAILGVAATLGYVFRQRREISRLRRDLRRFVAQEETQPAHRLPAVPKTNQAQQTDDGI